jgi:hypothetical protein
MSSTNNRNKNDQVENSPTQLRQRRNLHQRPTSPPASVDDDSKYKKKNRGNDDNENQSSTTWWSLVVFIVSLAVRLPFAARYNQVWDCDETYNYWEPMHSLWYV